jgi:hypothetical protein
MHALARDIQSDDGIANAAIEEAACRLKEQADAIDDLQGQLDEQGTTIAKLSLYEDTGGAIVPGVDEAWYWSPVHRRVVWTDNGKVIAGNRCYSTEAACTKAEVGR